MINNRENIQTVTIGLKPMRIVVSDTIAQTTLQTMLKNDPERREAKQMEDVTLVPSRFAASQSSGLGRPPAGSRR